MIIMINPIAEKKKEKLLPIFDCLYVCAIQDKNSHDAPWSPLISSRIYRPTVSRVIQPPPTYVVRVYTYSCIYIYGPIKQQVSNHFDGIIEPSKKVNEPNEASTKQQKFYIFSHLPAGVLSPCTCVYAYLYVYLYLLKYGWR